MPPAKAARAAALGVQRGAKSSANSLDPLLPETLTADEHWHAAVSLGRPFTKFRALDSDLTFSVAHTLGTGEAAQSWRTEVLNRCHALAAACAPVDICIQGRLSEQISRVTGNIRIFSSWYSASSSNGLTGASVTG